MSKNQGSINRPLLSFEGLLDARRRALYSEQGEVPSNRDALSVFPNTGIITAWPDLDRRVTNSLAVSGEQIGNVPG